MLWMIFCAAPAMLAAMTQIEQLEPNLWRVEASIKTPPLERVMTIVKLSDGSLLIYSAIMLDEPAMKQLDALGPVKTIVVPNGWHRMDAPAFKARYPEARLLAPKNTRARVAKVVAVDGTLEDFSDPTVQLTTVGGTRGLEALMTVKSGDRTSVVFTDALFNMPHKTGLNGFILKHVLGSSGGPKVTRLGRLLLIKDKKEFAAQLEQLAAQNVTRVIVAHNEVISVDVAGVLRGIAASVS